MRSSKIIGRPPVEIARRATMTPTRKRRVWEAHQGRCEECGRHLPVEGPEIAYDHIIPLQLGGADDDANLQPLCTVPCHAKKTAHDLTQIAKAKRRAEEIGQDRRKRELRSRPFDQTKTKRMDGAVVPRKVRVHISSEDRA